MFNIKGWICRNNPENSFTTKVGKHFPSGFSISRISSFKIIANKHDVYRGKDCMKKFCESLRERTINIINFKKKKMKLLTNEQQESYKNANTVMFAKKNLKTNLGKIKNIVKLEIIAIIQGNIEVLHIAYII